MKSKVIGLAAGLTLSSMFVPAMAGGLGYLSGAETLPEKAKEAELSITQQLSRDGRGG
jgi:hypothetical protein